MSDETILTALRDNWHEVYPPDETMLVAHAAVVAEVIDSEGNQTLRCWRSSELASWAAVGMLTAATRLTTYDLDAGWEEADE